MRKILFMSEMIDTSHMKGSDLFRYYTMTGTDHEYGSTLRTAHLQVGDSLFSMLEQCEREGKRIRLEYDKTLLEAGAMDCPFAVVIS